MNMFTFEKAKISPQLSSSGLRLTVYADSLAPSAKSKRWLLHQPAPVLAIVVSFILAAVFLFGTTGRKEEPPKHDLEKFFVSTKSNNVEVVEPEHSSAESDSSGVANPTHYNLACGTVESYETIDSQTGNTVKFIGDNFHPGVKIEGDSSEVTFTKDCGPICNFERWGKKFKYVLQIRPGKYFFKLYVSDGFWSAEGSRNFNIHLQDTEVVHQLDVFSKTKKKDAVYISENLPVDVEGNELEIEFEATKDNAICNALQVFPQ